MSSVEFFDADLLHWWVDRLQRAEVAVKLPIIDDAWYEEVMSCIEVTRLRPDFRNDIHLAGASVFYKVNKNHYRVDGNKRSAVICSYLFYIVNGYHLAPEPDDLYEFARKVAKDQEGYEKNLVKIKKFFEDNTKKV